MSDPKSRQQQSPDPSDETSPTPFIGYAAALERIRLVTAWYSEAIGQEEQSESPDVTRLAALRAERRSCTADERALADADAAEITRTATAYARRYRGLRTPD
ncbi:hypothetical protein [Streptomyces sp. NPDC047061]|uniref:hypothetical protein n=1 Tax=Streptomyces sp. NPDC047061 TaxID=3154605 RepID=UPI0033C09A58